jgi:hypothetical protein
LAETKAPSVRTGDVIGVVLAGQADVGGVAVSCEFPAGQALPEEFGQPAAVGGPDGLGGRGRW